MSTDIFFSPNEQLFWKGSPAFKPFVVQGIYEFVGSLKFLFFVWMVIILVSKIGGNEIDWAVMKLMTFTILAFHVFKLAQRYFDQKATTYYLTNRRVVILNKMPPSLPSL